MKEALSRMELLNFTFYSPLFNVDLYRILLENDETFKNILVFRSWVLTRRFIFAKLLTRVNNTC